MTMRWILILMILAAGLAACDDDENCGPSDAPADHTVSEDCARHLPGLREPEENCTACHGTDLRGGAGPSCYSCHGKEW
jgi:hypothetical protein